MNTLNVRKIGPKDWAHLPTGSVILIAGIVTDYEEGGHDSDKGVWFRFKGEFESRFRDPDGDEIAFQSIQCFLPDVASYPLRGACDESEGKVQFALKLSKMKDDNPRGWTWVYEPLGESFARKESLLELLGGNGGLPELPALPDPEAEAEAGADPAKKAARKAAKKTA